MAILPLRRFSCEMFILAHFGEFFGGLTPKCSRMLSRPERHILGRKHAFWHRPDRSRNTTWARAEESKKKEKKRKSDIWQVTYLPRHPRCATSTKVVL